MGLNPFVINEAYDTITFLLSSFVIISFAVFIVDLFLKHVMKTEGL